MVCPRCGEDCHCDAVVRSAKTTDPQPRFQPEPSDGVRLVDPECFDPSEQQFSASLEEERQGVRPRFEPSNHGLTAALPNETKALPSISAIELSLQPEVGTALPDLLHGAGESFLPVDSPAAPEEPDAWRRELAARLSQYRSKRKVKEPRYPSLRLNFDPPQQTWNAASLLDPPSPLPRTSGSATYVGRQSAAVERIEPQAQFEIEPALRIEEVAPLEEIEPTAKIIEFPRSYGPPARLDELAEPVMDRPRIVEAPEIVPPPPAMGGILMASTTEQREPERRPGLDVPLQSAPLGRRILAAVTDLLIVLLSLAAFGYVAYHLIEPLPPVLRIVEAGIVVTAVFWSIYQYMLIVYNGSTPGLRAAGLQLRRFDGRSANRSVRRWRVITSILSGLSLGMGYGWSFLDEDGLCWHDRITHTYLEPKPNLEPKPKQPNAS